MNYAAIRDRDIADAKRRYVAIRPWRWFMPFPLSDALLRRAHKQATLVFRAQAADHPSWTYSVTDRTFKADFIDGIIAEVLKQLGVDSTLIPILTIVLRMLLTALITKLLAAPQSSGFATVDSSANHFLAELASQCATA